MTANEPSTGLDYTSVGLTTNNQRVRLTIETPDDIVTIALSQEAAITLAGQIQGFALQIRKP